MRAGEGRLALRAAPPPPPAASPSRALRRTPAAPSPMLYYSMKHRTQLYLDDAQHRWLRQRAGASGSIAAVVRELIDAERRRRGNPAADPLLRFLVEEAPGRGREGSSVATLDDDLYGS
jgi:hypothetical protein